VATQLGLANGDDALEKKRQLANFFLIRMPKYGTMGEMKDLLLVQARMLYRDKILFDTSHYRSRTSIRCAIASSAALTAAPVCRELECTRFRSSYCSEQYVFTRRN